MGSMKDEPLIRHAVRGTVTFTILTGTLLGTKEIMNGIIGKDSPISWGVGGLVSGLANKIIQYGI